jgi:hypothetical protein
MIWPCGPEKVGNILLLLNIHTIQFTMKIETEDHLPFLDTDVYKRPHGSLDIKNTGNPPISSFIRMPGLTTIWAGPKRDEVTKSLRKLHNEQLHICTYSSPHIITMIKSRKMRSSMGR